MSETEYRYVAARGVEFRDEGFMSWARVPDTMLAEMTATELRKVADAMDGGPTIQPALTVAAAPRVATDEEAAVALLRRWAADPGASGDGYIRLTPCEANHVLNALDRATAERDAASGSAAALLEREAKLNSRIRDLEAQVAAKDGELFDASEAYRELRAELARLTATEDTPLGWCNIYDDGSAYFHVTAEMAKFNGSGPRITRVAVPVYERPPRATARVTDATPNVRSASVRFADILAIQKEEAERDPSDAYMVGLYNGMSMMIANVDGKMEWHAISVARDLHTIAADAMQEGAK